MSDNGQVQKAVDSDSGPWVQAAERRSDDSKIDSHAKS
jgi:hypothetical protein